MFKVSVLPFLLFSIGAAAADPKLSSTEFAGLTALMQQKIEGRPAFQGSALLMHGTELLWQYHHGNISPTQPFDRHTGFFVGSISKPLAATLVMQQVQAGTLDLQAPVKRYLPELPYAWTASVRVADLLSHTSGLIESNSQQNYGAFRYNNLNFQLLGQILTAVTKRPYADLAAELLQQCGMSQAGFLAKATTVVQGWHEEQGQLKAITGFMPPEAQPSGGLIASAADVALLPLCVQQQLTKTSVQQMTHPVVLRPHRWGELYYGYGVQIMQTSAGEEWSHGGYIPGYVSAFNHFPQHQLTLVVLENQSLDTANFGRAVYYHDQLRQSVIQILSASE